ncbi:MAG: PD40 domain-containing protein [Anaerolineae bacterium]|nr:PD40 domain-containing protein [Anaerolineae bacterium]
MSERTDRLSSPQAAMRWPLLAMLAVTVFAGSLLAGVVVEASLAPDASPQPEAQAAIVSTTVITNTRAFLPIVVSSRLHGVTLNLPAERGTIGLPQRFVAEVAAADGTTPLTYTWQATGQAHVVHVGGLSDSVDLVWDLTGNKVITVEVSDGHTTVQASAAFDLTTRGMIAFEQKTTDTYQHDILIIHNEHTDVVYNLTNTPDIDEGAPAWSPDGNWIAFAAGELSGGNRSIYKIDLTTRQVYTVTGDATVDRWPAWSPDGTRIAFMRNQPGFPADKPIFDIFVIDVDGSNQQQLTNWPYYDEYPAWSPDGQSIAFISNRDYGARDVYLMDPDGGNVRRVLNTPDQHEVYPSWSPDGHIYYTAYVDRPQKEWLYRLDPDTGIHSRVFSDSYNRYIASFAPDGRCFSFYSIMGDTEGTDKEVWKWCEGYTWPVNLTRNAVSDEYSAWSPVP